jgi:hypothetical protein
MIFISISDTHILAHFVHCVADPRYSVRREGPDSKFKCSSVNSLACSLAENFGGDRVFDGKPLPDFDGYCSTWNKIPGYDVRSEFLYDCDGDGQIDKTCNGTVIYICTIATVTGKSTKRAMGR